MTLQLVIIALLLFNAALIVRANGETDDDIETMNHFIKVSNFVWVLVAMSFFYDTFNLIVKYVIPLF